MVKFLRFYCLNPGKLRTVDAQDKGSEDSGGSENKDNQQAGIFDFDPDSNPLDQLIYEQLVD